MRNLLRALRYIEDPEASGFRFLIGDEVGLEGLVFEKINSEIRNPNSAI